MSLIMLFYLDASYRKFKKKESGSTVGALVDGLPWSGSAHSSEDNESFEHERRDGRAADRRFGFEFSARIDNLPRDLLSRAVGGVEKEWVL